MSTRKERERAEEAERKAAEKAAKKAELAAKRAARDAERQAKKEEKEAEGGGAEPEPEEEEVVDPNAWTEEEEVALVTALKEFPKGSHPTEKERWQAGPGPGDDDESTIV